MPKTDVDLLPNTSLTLGDARSRLSGLHFAKDALSDSEREILYIAEALLRHIDATETLSPAQKQMRALAMQPGLQEISLYDDGVEFAGTPSDSDAQAGFIEGTFTLTEVRTAVGTGIPVTDRRTAVPRP